jgi:hypothetical protein
MRKILIGILGIMVLFMLGCGSSTTTTDTTVDYTLEVTDLNGALVEGALVELVNLDTGDIYNELSDFNGRVVFEGIDSESGYSLTISKDGYPTFEATVSVDADGAGVVLQGTGEPETGTIKIKVVDENANPMENVKVTLSGVTGAEYETALPIEKYTGDTGITTFNDLEIVSFQVVMEKEGYETVEQAITPSTDAETVTVEMIRKIDRVEIISTKSVIAVDSSDKATFSIAVYDTANNLIEKDFIFSLKRDGVEYTGLNFWGTEIGNFEFKAYLNNYDFMESSNSVNVAVVPEITTGSSLTIVNKLENTVLYPDWYIDYPSNDSIYDFAPDAVGEDWGLVAGNYSQNQVVPESTYYVYFILDDINTIFRSAEPVVVGENTHIVYVIDDETSLTEISRKRSEMESTKDKLREIYKAKKQKKYKSVEGK